MFERPRHQKIAKLLRSMDADLLTHAKCYFGGGTAIALKLGEYRESVDVNFLRSDMPTGLGNAIVATLEAQRSRHSEA
jgi:hypothetical protein